MLVRSPESVFDGQSTIMSDSIRSTSGCWTCRVRRKKCDEAKPSCSTCASLQLLCYGYGQKPEWMDRGPKEKEFARAMRDAVKQTLKTQRLLLFQQSTQSNHEISPDHAHDSVTSGTCGITGVQDSRTKISSSSDLTHSSAILYSSDESLHLNAHDPDSAQSNQNSAPLASSNLSNTVHRNPISRVLTDSSWSILPIVFEEDQADLLMHFFDNVFPLQFRFYSPSISEGGRGWLLSILTRTKPLYHVALSLAAYHQQSILARDTGISCAASLGKLQERHIESIKELRHHLERFQEGTQTNTLQETIEILACITLLIALELFRGDTNDWQMHLQAASTVLVTLKAKSRDLKNGISSSMHKYAMKFFTGVIVWYNILSCASARLKPLSMLTSIDDGDIFQYLQLDRLMGCENWAVFLILEIATLDEWKRRTQSTGRLSMRELVRRASEIEERLDAGLIGNSQQPQNETSTAVRIGATSHPSESDNLTRDITRVFACAALVYLQVVISGPQPDLLEIKQSVIRTTDAFNALVDKDLVRNVLWPVCITGCMASAEYEPYFRDLVSGVGSDKWSFGYPSKVLKVMEECWRLRRIQPGMVAVNWMDAMDSLQMRVLLV